MGSSTYYAKKIEALTCDKNTISGLFSSLEKCSSAIKDSSRYSDKITISGDKIDQGNLSKMSDSLATVSSNLTAIINECNEKIALYQNLYEQALSREREQAEIERLKKAN